MLPKHVASTLLDGEDPADVLTGHDRCASAIEAGSARGAGVASRPAAPWCYRNGDDFGFPPFLA